MGFLRGVSGRLLIVTLLIVMLVEVVIFIPSVARFRIDYLNERLARAEMAVLVMLAYPMGIPDLDMQRALLEKAEVSTIVVHRDGARAMMLAPDPPQMVESSYDLRSMMSVELVADALSRLASPPGPHYVRVIGMPPQGAEALEITLDAAPLRAAMLDYGLRILRLSLIISVLTAAVVFLAIRRTVVAPMTRVIDSMKSFQQNPEDATRIIEPKARIGELAEAEQALAGLQRDVQGALKARARLASLGEALAKISHDLRNMLAAQQLLFDRLETSSDPTVVRVMPKMLATLDRAIRLCQRTLDFGRAEETAPELREVALAALVHEVAETLGLGPDTVPVAVRIEVPGEHTVPADPEQLYRVIANLMRNAAEALAESGRRGEITVSTARENGLERICIADTGPGLPARAREHIFKPFRGGARRGGTGLGLAIAHELVAAHGGRLELLRSTTEGTVFEIRLPRSAAAGTAAREAARAG
ncbi:HAMP domain-containing sensor histidine kinase [Paralimibaculum aggregatum]|uniref:histidine kinase n=1 Tax=Paralimibaculum aggregatum TaxID=3036245 RepID=A0ABQ6LL93_9RHOB|nr:HAMP domain-containing sensor histidine kinase [Limibaculum sp. NKW23]GMG83201.1 HAMP domain-containing sensor histidine kinase [Limibaculum sp. NKW23]